MNLKGKIISIYQDPITKNDYEGEAVCISLKKKKDIDGLERWLVHFVGDLPGETYVRLIDVTDIRKNQEEI